MSGSKILTKEKIKQYSNKAILSKVNPEFIGIASQYSSIKKQRIMSQQFLDSVSHEYSTIDKINRNLQKSINRKKNELKYVQQVRNRYLTDLDQKRQIQTQKRNQLERLRYKSNEERYYSMTKLAQAKEDLSQKKRKEANEVRKKANMLESTKRMEESRIWEANNSRVKEVSNEKKRINDYCNRFFQNKNKKFLQNYKDLMAKEKNQDVMNQKKMRNLEEKLVLIRQKTAQRQRELQKLDESVESIKSSSKSLRSSRVQSTRSMTPYQILSTPKEIAEQSKTKGLQIETKPKMKLILG